MGFSTTFTGGGGAAAVTGLAAATTGIPLGCPAGFCIAGGAGTCGGLGVGARATEDFGSSVAEPKPLKKSVDKTPATNATNNGTGFSRYCCI